MAILFSSMFANAMFYELGDAKDSLRIKFGPIDFTWRELMIGVQSSLIVLPVNLLIITLFRCTRPPIKAREQGCGSASAEKYKEKKEASIDKTTKDKRQAKAAKTQKEATKLKNVKGKMERTVPNPKLSGAQAFGRKASPETKKRKKFRLPYWFNYVAYTLALLTSLTGATFSMFYSMILGKEKSNKWIASIVISLVQDIFFLQPLKVIMVASILAILFRKPPEEERDEVDDEEVSDLMKDDLGDATTEEDKIRNAMPVKSLPDPIEVSLDREKRLNEVKMFTVFYQVAVQLLFIFLLSIASYGSRSVNRIYMSKNIQDIFNSKLDKVINYRFCIRHRGGPFTVYFPPGCILQFETFSMKQNWMKFVPSDVPILRPYTAILGTIFFKLAKVLVISGLSHRE